MNYLFPRENWHCLFTSIRPPESPSCKVRVYRSAEEPCKLCQQRGLPCGAKILNSTISKDLLNTNRSESYQTSAVISRCIANCQDDFVLPSDRQYLALIRVLSEIQFSHRNGVAFEQYTDINVRSIDVNRPEASLRGCDIVSLPWPKFPLSSRAFRFAALAFASSNMEGDHTDSKTPNYLAKFFKYIQEALQEKKFTEIGIACYTMILYHCITIFDDPSSFESMLTHLGGFCKVVIELKRRTMSNDQNNLFDVLWDAAFHVLQHIYWARAKPNTQQLQQELFIVEKVHEVFQNFAVLHELALTPPIQDPAARSVPHYTPLTQFRRRSLCFYLDYFLTVRKQSIIEKSTDWTQSPVVRSLRQTLQKIQRESGMQDIPFRSSALPLENAKAALLVAFAKLLEDVFFTSPNDKLQIIHSAYALYRLCQTAILLPWSNHQSLPLTRYLFWTGIFVTQAIDPVGMTTNIVTANLIANEWIMAALDAQMKILISTLHVKDKDEVNYVYNLLFKLLGIVNSLSHTEDVLSCKLDELNIFTYNRWVNKLLI